MQPRRFHELALSLPQSHAHEQSARIDFVIGEAVFATMFPKDQWCVVKMTGDLQSSLVAEDPDSFEACRGAWGRAGATVVRLDEAEEGMVHRALLDAWRKWAPKEHGAL